MKCPNSQKRTRGRLDVGPPEHAWGNGTHAPGLAVTSSFHCTAQEKQILSITPEPWLFLPLMVMLDPGYRNVKWSTNTKRTLKSNDFFFLSPLLKGEGKKKKKLHLASFPWPATNSIKLQKQCFEMLEDADRKLKKDFTQKLKTCFSKWGLSVRRDCILTARAHGNWEHN